MQGRLSIVEGGQKKGHSGSPWVRYGCAGRNGEPCGLICAFGATKRLIYGELQDSRGAEPATSISSPNTPIPIANMMRSPMINICVRCVTESMGKPPCSLLVIIGLNLADEYTG
jgi:hypothetical protein